MVILQYIQAIDFRGGGPPRAVVDLSRVLHTRGHDVIVATTAGRDIPREWHDEAGPEAVCLPPVAGPLGRFARDGLFLIHGLISRADVVHLHGVWEPANLQVATACRALKRPYIISPRGMLDDWSMSRHALRKRVHLALAGRKCLAQAAAIHCTAEAELQQSRKWFPAQRGVVIPNLIDLRPYQSLPQPDEAFDRWPELRDASFTVLFLSRVHAKKGLEHLIHAIARLTSTLPGIRLVIAGGGDPGYLQSLQRLTISTGLASHTTWAGTVDGSIKRSLYAAADLTALPTSQENFGFVFFESLAAGTPVVTTDLVDTCDELIQSGGAMIVPQSSEAFKTTIEAFATGRLDASSMGLTGRQWTLRELASDQIASRFESLYQSCMDQTL